LTILRETLEEMGVPSRVREHWLAHTVSQRDSVVRGPCNDGEPPQ
jgi:hypothetical protein